MAKGDIHLDYNEIEQVSARLNSAADNMVPQLSALRGEVSRLLSNGLVFRQTSPKMEAAYQKFNDSLTAAVKQINSFAQQFKDIRQQMEEMDNKMASGMDKNSS
ncbi:hypothetical protein [Streptomyces clavuligerus]|uniref:WXG100 family type VII secretion target n=1 Tax=Streptomyces clavuligerus TaxID=1901 RepID=B5H2N7_STRCL|nr:hypothetical protein [Streptomyces clavuligerus]EDY52833.1 hypothetical protein SSCG_05891 [Streptomyces clavuligerus]EFG04161.1 Hypothetical protein SCLAV_p0674 [Streptomyces clavuligerus]MBY6307358.1 hypothetical protein [Streptomyces clavuligerus]QCS10078.1 hypothetical protein CRV15_31360 [Streptomyces clavuligerus]QPJ97877.1 hypothetical protein GE265_33090 [Streptomyces clavuligerus]